MTQTDICEIVRTIDEVKTSYFVHCLLNANLAAPTEFIQGLLGYCADVIEVVCVGTDVQEKE